MIKSSAMPLILVALVAAVGIGVYTCAYTVKEHEQAVILAFGEVVGTPITDPGLHFKVPWYEARKFDKRWLAWDGDPNQITTLDKRYILIDVFARWKIADPLIFIEKLRDEESAQGRLDDILDSATRNVIANHNLIEAIRSTNRQFKISEEERENLLSSYEDLDDETGEAIPAAVAAIIDPSPDTDTADENRSSEMTDTDDASQQVDSQNGEKSSKTAPAPAVDDAAAPSDDIDEQESSIEEHLTVYKIQYGRQKLTELIIEKASQKARELGIELKDVRLKRIDYIPSVQQSVFDRMVSERHKVAARLRSQGDGLSAEILGRKERDLKKIRSEAYRKAEEVRGKADATAARIYADAYKLDPELYQFLKTLDSYRKTLGDKTWLIITTDSEYGAYLKSSK